MFVRCVVAIVALAALAISAGCFEAPPAKAKAPETKKAEEKKPAVKAAEPKEEAKKEEIVFDPRKPPAGYRNCHRNHCHRIGGGVASYKQVMEEMGATKIVGVPKQAPMPKAPADVAAAPDDAVKTASGLAYKVLKAGEGTQKPGPTSVVTIHYTGWTTDGKAFDSSIARGKTASVPLDKMFPGWTEGLQTMTVGEEKRFWIPENLAFQGQKGRPQGMVVFDIELIGIR